MATYQALPLPSELSGATTLLLSDPRLVSLECDVSVDEAHRLRYLAAICWRAMLPANNNEEAAQLHRKLTDLLSRSKDAFFAALSSVLRSSDNLVTPDDCLMSASSQSSSAAPSVSSGAADECMATPAHVTPEIAELQRLIRSVEYAAAMCRGMSAKDMLSADHMTPTMMPVVDEVIFCGGFRPGMLVELSGPSGAGKTRLVGQWLAAAAAQGRSVTVIPSDWYSLDHALLTRLVRIMCEKTGESFGAATARIRFTDGVRCLRDLTQFLEFLRRSTVGGAALLVVDSFTVLAAATERHEDAQHSDGGRTKAGPSVRRAAPSVHAAASLKTVAEELGICVVIVTGTAMTSADFQHAVNIRLALTPSSRGAPTAAAVLRVLKSPMGDAVVVPLHTSRGEPPLYEAHTPQSYPQ